MGGGLLDVGLMQGDCLELMQDIPDKSVDLILTDPPYNIGKAKWDKIPNYIEWCGKWFKECERLLKDNGSFYFWHNDMVQIAQLMEWIRQNTGFVFNSFCVWDKGDFRALSWKNPSDANNLRSWFNTCEYCIAYTLQDDLGLNHFLLRNGYLKEMVGYCLSERAKTGLTMKEISALVGQSSPHFWRCDCHWRFPSEDIWKRLQTTGCFQKPYVDLCKEYQMIRDDYENLRYTHNLDPCHNNVWRSTERNNGQHHVCKKPTDTLARIITTSSNEGDTVLDCFMGSGSTGVACVNTNRNFIGIELDADYFKIAERRIAEAGKQLAI